MSDTTPRRNPVVRAWPTPRILSRGAFFFSPTASAITTVVLADPMSRPVMMRSGFIAALRSPDRDIVNRARQRVPAGEQGHSQRERYRPTAPLTALTECALSQFRHARLPYRSLREGAAPRCERL